MAYEKTVVVGHIGSSGMLKSASGLEYFKMTVCVDRSKGKAEKQIWYNVFLFDEKFLRSPSGLSRYAKGRLVLVEGRPQVDAYMTNAGKPAIDYSIICSEFPELLDNKPVG